MNETRLAYTSSVSLAVKLAPLRFATPFIYSPKKPYLTAVTSCVNAERAASSTKSENLSKNESVRANLVPRSLVDKADGEDLVFGFVHKRSGINVRLNVTCLDAKLGILFPWGRLQGTI